MNILGFDDPSGECGFCGFEGFGGFCVSGSISGPNADVRYDNDDTLIVKLSFFLGLSIKSVVLSRETISR